METYKKVIWISIVAAVLLMVPLIYHFFFSNEEAAPPVEVKEKLSEGEKISGPLPGAVKKVTDPEPITDMELSGVKLNGSDKKVRELLVSCSSNREFERWIINGDLVRRFVATVDNISRGESPGPHLEFLQPKGKFKTIRRGENIYLDPSGYRRYDKVAEVIASLDGVKLAALYRRMRPLIDEAYKELGYPEKKFGHTLREAVAMIVNTPVPEGDVLLDEKVLTYTYNNTRLEVLNGAQKHLIRMGPENAKKVKDKLKEISAALE